MDDDAEDAAKGDELREAVSRFDGDLYVHSGGITFGQEAHFARMLNANRQKSDKATLWLTTPGGDPDTAYQICRLMQNNYKHFAVYINGWCKSSGTLVCLGATEIIMDDLGQLGPLDIQILNKEEFGERLSGLNPIEALKSISIQSLDLFRQQFFNVRFGGGLSTKQALEVATNLTGQLMSPITAQLDIMKYGEFTRSMRIAVEYGNRLAKGCPNGNLKPEAVNALTTGYPSHGFVIDRAEASEAIFNNVSRPSDDLLIISEKLQGLVDSYMGGSNNQALIVDLRFALGIPASAEDASAHAEAVEEEQVVDVAAAAPSKAANQKSRSTSKAKPRAVKDAGERGEQLERSDESTDSDGPVPQ